MPEKPIYSFDGDNRFLSNFWPVYISCNNLIYPSVENAYQATKMFDIEDRKLFINIKASEAKRLGKVLPMREDWEEIRLDVMLTLVRKKFDPALNAELVFHLRQTGSRELQEGNWWGDTFWGTVNGKGENHLGKILMRVRKELCVS